MPCLGKFSYFLLGGESDCRGWGGEMLLKCKDLNVSHFEVEWETRSRWLQSALWDCFGGQIFHMAANLSLKTVPQCTLTTISTQSPEQPLSG